MVQEQQNKSRGGRPSSCTPEKLSKARYYLDHYDELGDIIPTIQSMAVYLGVARNTLYNWARNPRNEEFLRIYESCMCRQEVVLINKGLLGQINQAMCRWMLIKHGYGKKSEMQVF